MARSMMYFTEPSFWGYALETVAKLLNMAPSKTVPQTPYKIWHGKHASYNYLRVWGSPAYVKRLVGDKLDSRFSLCRFIRYPKESAGYYFYDRPSKRSLSRETQYSWRRAFLWITNEMRCYLGDQVNYLSKTTRHHLNLQFPVMVFQSSID
ncbi:UNVERIFIED_CONTAM: hypothetical protein Sangu_3241600 [Sesamum angustifolium]|uniref:Uncharacterized protein n=1 Tax=Sesamum angustifolium TaxID=2727405 RepID=A0AAW2JH55_9LAMI